MICKGNAIVIKGEHVNVDTAMGWYLGKDALPPPEIAGMFMARYDPEIAKMAKSDDILVCGRNFGFGKIHRSFWYAMKNIGIKCIVAESFSTQMFQNALSNGFLLTECPNVLDEVCMGDEIEVDVENAVIYNAVRNKRIIGRKAPEFSINVMRSGGMGGYLAAAIKDRAI